MSGSNEHVSRPLPPAELSALLDAQEQRHLRDASVEAYATESDPIAKRVTVYISFSTKDQGLAEKLAEEITIQLKTLVRDEYEVTVWTSSDTPLGEDITTVREEHLCAASAAVVLLSPSYLADDDESKQVHEHFPHPVLVRLKELPQGASFAPFDSKAVIPGRAYHNARTTAAREEIAQHVASRVRDQLRQDRERFTYTAPADPADPAQLARERLAAARLSENTEFIESEAYLGKFSESLDLTYSKVDDRSRQSSSNRFVAIDRLQKWATDHSTQSNRLCALLGDLGTGKTTTSILFARRLLDEYEDEAGTDAPLPLYFDLRDLTTSRLSNFGLRSMLEQMINQSSPHPVNVDQVIETIRSHECIVIFDGLDEVLVHLEEREGQKLTRGLLQVLTLTNDAGKALSKLMLTCRSQYFRSVRDELSFFSNQNREWVRGEDYLVLTMLPFEEEQILEYLERNIPGSDPQRLLEMISSVHDLRSLAKQPVMLNMIRDVLPDIEQALADGRRFRAVDLYGRFVHRWLERDDAKHMLKSEHKRILMSRMAVEVWKSERRTWPADWMETWMLRFLDDHRELKLEYREWMPDQWKQDLRTATFLSRREDVFTFAHSSLLEYFLAKGLVEALLGDDPDSGEALNVWDLPRTSQESLVFFGELLDALDPPDRQQALKTLTRVAHEGTPRARTLAFSYVLLARQRGFPNISTREFNLADVDLSSWQIGVENQQVLDLTGIDFSNARLDDAVLTNVKLDNSDWHCSSLRRTRLISCTLTGANLTGSDLTGTIFRYCDLSRLDIGSATTYRTQLLFSRSSHSGPDVLNAPIDEQAVPFTTSPELYLPPFRITTAEWNPERLSILTAGPNGAQIWDAVTGEQTRTLTTATTTTGAWSPDGLHILTTGPNGARVWDANTGGLTHTLTTMNTRAGAWSPNASNILTTGSNGAIIWNADTGQSVLSLGDDRVNEAFWRPDGILILTVTTEDIKLWNAATGELIRTLDILSNVYTCAWHPDDHRLLTVGSSGHSIWDSCTGERIATLTIYDSDGGSWSPDGKQLVTVGADGTQIWDGTTGRLSHKLATLYARSASWSPDGTKVLTWGSDGAYVWDADTGHMIINLTKHYTTSCAWSPNGAHVVANTNQGVYIYMADRRK
ncbi:pentapeptide repeat-containing protein [Actinomyces qiguomingii]|uniref:pentapeptide repeat-containing protein n=1 Tax=Actinomyces qiguomingii TaxID=2057800 RepID=UPI000CA034A5|nr:pentapeptide repeat-containing protein [Actinomyces qiguomingii]